MAMSNRVEWRGAGLTFVLTWAVYLLTLAPDLPPGHDSAELTTAAFLPGVAHPPSYPLYVMLGHLFCQIPIGSPAYRMNLMAGLCCALAAALGFAAFYRVTQRFWPALGGALSFAFAVTPWRQAVGAEKYSLHLTLLALVLWLSADWTRLDPACRSQRLRWLALAFGLGLSHHHTMVLALPGLLLLLATHRPTSWRGLLWFPLGLLPYCYTPLRALQHPALNWGDPSTLQRFWWVLTRSGYGGVTLSTQHAAGTDLAQVGHFFESLLVWQFPVTALCALGCLRPRKRDPETWTLLSWLVHWLLMGVGFACIAHQPADEGHFDMVDRFYAGSDLVFAGFLAVGWARLRWCPPLLALGALVVGALHWPDCSLRGQQQPGDLERAIFSRLPIGSIYLPISDLTAGGALYEQLVLGERTDVQVILPGLIQSDWYHQPLIEPLAPLAELCVRWRSQGHEVYFDAFQPDIPGFFEPQGVIFRYLAPGEPLPDRAQVETANFDFLQRQVLTGDYHYEPNTAFWTHDILERWSVAYRNIADALATSDPTRARRALTLARELHPEPARDAEIESRIRR
jgi:hypothetical protein